MISLQLDDSIIPFFFVLFKKIDLKIPPPIIIITLIVFVIII